MLDSALSPALSSSCPSPAYPDRMLSTLEEADARLGVDPQAVAAVGPETFVRRWRGIRADLLAERITPQEARVALFGEGR